MDFAIRNLSVLAYAQGFTLWHYRAPQAPLAALASPGYFNLASDILATGDMLMMSARDGGRVAFVVQVSVEPTENVQLAPLS